MNDKLYLVDLTRDQIELLKTHEILDSVKVPYHSDQSLYGLTLKQKNLADEIFLFSVDDRIEGMRERATN